MAIGSLISDLRKAHGWSQGRLAQEINEAFGTNLDREYVSRWEREVKRRTLLTDVAAMAIAPVAASDLLAAGFSARLRGGPSADEWEEKLSSYGTEYMM